MGEVPELWLNESGEIFFSALGNLGIKCSFPMSGTPNDFAYGFRCADFMTFSQEKNNQKLGILFNTNSVRDKLILQQILEFFGKFITYLISFI